ncbi:FtsL-like putative cell division protein [Hufsiella ginkgonis]|uniref:S-adenosyl-methyltransferase n=1 Tax=Hufsiella ginkgonis TaxID=2695274 RepID=A0A7K1XSH1_9SPHI|nr:FtsL-like putative cell division protein [Hufsiella ginkgonis]MXV13850.1 hypothetical protein [Hufsiella ginkgonis]
MSNRFRDELADEEQEAQTAQKPEKAELPKNFFTTLLTEGVVSKDTATEMLPFVIFLAFLAMIYIGNRHLTERNIRDINKLNKEVKELNWDFKILKANLMQKSTQTEVARHADSLGLKEPIEPPKKITISE